MTNQEHDDGACGAQCCSSCGPHFAYMFCRNFETTEQYRHWVKLFHLIDEREVLREFISNFSDDPSFKLSWHKSRIREIKYRIYEQLAIIMKHAVHLDEVAVYLASTADEEV